MKKLYRVLKLSVLACITVIVLLGTNIEANAAIQTLEWSSGAKVMYSKGDSVLLKGVYNAEYNDDYYLHTEMYPLQTINSTEGTQFNFVFEGGAIECKMNDLGYRAFFVTTGDEVPVAETSSNKSGSPCNHEWVDEIITYATQTEDGSVANKCKFCGEIQSGSQHTVSGYEIFIHDTAKAIRDSKKSEIIIKTDRWVSFSKLVFDAMEARPDVAVTVNYEFENKNYTLTIPAGTKGSDVLDANGFCGFRYLDGLFHGSEIVK